MQFLVYINTFLESSFHFKCRTLVASSTSLATLVQLRTESQYIEKLKMCSSAVNLKFKITPSVMTKKHLCKMRAYVT